MLDKMEKLGLVRKNANKKRALTDKGKAAAENL